MFRIFQDTYSHLFLTSDEHPASVLEPLTSIADNRDGKRLNQDELNSQDQKSISHTSLEEIELSDIEVAITKTTPNKFDTNTSTASSYGSLIYQLNNLINRVLIHTDPNYVIPIHPSCGHRREDQYSLMFSEHLKHIFNLHQNQKYSAEQLGQQPCILPLYTSLETKGKIHNLMLEEFDIHIKMLCHTKQDDMLKAVKLLQEKFIASINHE